MENQGFLSQPFLSAEAVGFELSPQEFAPRHDSREMKVLFTYPAEDRVGGHSSVELLVAKKHLACIALGSSREFQLDG